MTPDEDQRSKRITILLVEPNPGDTRLFTESFKDAQVKNTLYTVSDSDAALDFIYQRGEFADTPPPDLVLLEPNVPGKNGMDVLSLLHNEQALCDVPVVVLTSSPVTEEIVKSHEFEADHYVRKPVEPEDFIRFVQDIEGLWIELVQQVSRDA